MKETKEIKGKIKVIYPNQEQLNKPCNVKLEEFDTYIGFWDELKDSIPRDFKNGDEVKITYYGANRGFINGSSIKHLNEGSKSANEKELDTKKEIKENITQLKQTVIKIDTLVEKL